jgi:hypothetical protein
MTIDDLYNGVKVIAIEDYYSGLIGCVSHILSGDEKESENECEHDIYVNFAEVENMREKYPELNGTGVDQLIMGIDEIAIILEDGTAVDFEGNIHMVHELIR